MAKPAELPISPRSEKGKAAKRLRAEGLIPANIFGHGEDSQAVKLKDLDFEELRRQHKATGVVSLKLSGGGRSQTALIRHVERNPVSRQVLHIDFMRVGMRDRITAKIPLRFEGEAPGDKLEKGVLLKLAETLEVECAAGDIVDAIEVDLASLEHIEDSIKAVDVKLPHNYTLITDPEEVVVKVATPRVEKEPEVEAPAEGEAEAAAEGAQAVEDEAAKAEAEKNEAAAREE
jgi:large subunit ribosomal protein L25